MHQSASLSDGWTDLLIATDFFEHAEAMRSEFDAAVGPQRSLSVRRFGWDYWYVPGQYGYIRSFARNFFSASIYRAYARVLSAWASERLGCPGYTEPWLSYYIEGCRQEFHTDVLNGPWAWVFSLTHWDQRRFSGGETALLGPRVLNYWRHFKADQPLEAHEIVRCIAPVFNQLTVFDTRIPHGVTTVEGTRDPLDSRVVLHGWFLPPQLRVDGGLTVRDTEAACIKIAADWAHARRDCERLNGTLVLRLRIDPEGTVTGACTVASTLVALEADQGAMQRATECALALASAARFPGTASASTVTVPLTIGNR
jgi:hypothetical protein